MNKYLRYFLEMLLKIVGGELDWGLGRHIERKKVMKGTSVFLF